MEKNSAKTGDRKTRAKKPKIPLDMVSQEGRKRGRPGIRPSEVLGRAENFRLCLDQVWDRLYPLLAAANTEDDVRAAFHQGASPYESYFVPLAALTLSVLRERKFPKRRQPQINFLADSLAAVGIVTPRRSRDICEGERTKTEHANYIIRYEFWVECSCGYKGKSRDHACRKCGAKITFTTDHPFL